MRRIILAKIQNMSQNEALSMVSNDTIERIKRTDRRPEIKVFSIAAEGVAEGTELNFGMKVKRALRYMKDMIVRIGERLQLGTPVFNRHADTNENTGREQIGEVVGKAVKYVGEKLMTLAAIYVYPQHKDKPLDIASFEANVEYIPKTFDKADVIDVPEISGIALSHSSIDTPAFKDATLLAAVQCFLPPETKEEKILARIKAARSSLKTKK